MTAGAAAPVLETARLFLRPLSAADGPFLQRLRNHPGVGRFLWDGRPGAGGEAAPG